MVTGSICLVYINRESWGTDFGRLGWFTELLYLHRNIFLREKWKALWAPIPTELLYNGIETQRAVFFSDFTLPYIFGVAQQTSERSLFKLKQSLSHFPNSLTFQSHSIMENKTLRIESYFRWRGNGFITVILFPILPRTEHDHSKWFFPFSLSSPETCHK